MYPAPGSLTGVTYLKMLCSHNMLLIYITNELIQWRQKYWPIQNYFDTILECWKITVVIQRSCSNWVIRVNVYVYVYVCVFLCCCACVCKDRERENDEGGMEGIFTNFWSIKIHQIKVLMWFMILLRKCKCFFFFGKKKSFWWTKGCMEFLIFFWYFPNRTIILVQRKNNFNDKYPVQ